MDSFSKRQGIVPEKAIQIDSMDEVLRNSLWNATTISIWQHVQTEEHLYVDDFLVDQPLKTLVSQLWVLHFKWLVDDMGESWSAILSKIRRNYFKMKWHEVYDFVEYIAKETFIFDKETPDSFRDLCNNYLEMESSGYRFVGDMIAPLTNKEEITEVNAALSSPHVSIRIQLESALAKLSDRKNPDYRNSIKDSISAVETV